MMSNALKDANQLKQTFVTLLTNQSEAGVWTGHVLDGVMEVIVKVCQSYFIISIWLTVTLFNNLLWFQASYQSGLIAA